MKDFFGLDEKKTTVRTEIVAGLTTFFTMAYIIFVNPLLLIPLMESIIMIFHKKSHWMLSRSVFRILTALSLSTLVLKGLFPETLCQENLYVFALVLPVYIAMSIRKD